MSQSQKKKNPSAFLRNLFQILQNDQFSDVICWVETGNGFMIKDLPQFEATILPKYFKHKKYSSFVRQLNMYCFHKQRNSFFQNCFLHQQFRKSNQLAFQIKRKPEKKKKGLSQSQLVAQSNQSWLAIGNSLGKFFPHVLENPLNSTMPNILKPIVLTKPNQESSNINIDQNPEAESLSEEQQYVSKISLKGLFLDGNEQQNQSKQNRSQEINVRESESMVQQENNSVSECISKQQLMKDQNQVIVKNNIKNENQILLPAIFSDSTLQSWSAISQILIKQNQILQRTHPVLRNMVLSTQKNKIDYLKQEMSELDKLQNSQTSPKDVNLSIQRMTEIITMQKQEIQRVSQFLNNQISTLSHISHQDNPLSTTSIHFGLQRRE